MKGMTLHVEGLRWHDPISVVGAPSCSYGYGVVAPPRVWGRGIRNAAHPPFRSPFPGVAESILFVCTRSKGVQTPVLAIEHD